MVWMPPALSRGRRQLTSGVEEDFSFFNTISAQVNDIENRPLNKYLSGYDQPFLFVLWRITPRPS